MYHFILGIFFFFNPFTPSRPLLVDNVRNNCSCMCKAAKPVKNNFLLYYFPFKASNNNEYYQRMRLNVWARTNSYTSNQLAKQTARFHLLEQIWNRKGIKWWCFTLNPLIISSVTEWRALSWVLVFNAFWFSGGGQNGGRQTYNTTSNQYSLSLLQYRFKLWVFASK